MKRVLSALLVLITCFSLFAVCTGAEGEPVAGAEAKKLDVSVTGFDTVEIGYMLDGSERTYSEYSAGTELQVSCSEEISYLYIEFFSKAALFTVTANGVSAECGKDLFLHTFVDVASAVGSSKSVVLTFPSAADVCVFSAYGAGTLPGDVQVWEAPDSFADLLMYSSHADDEQLFFAGVLPTAVARGASVQVVYFCDHSAESARPHEQLNGLWAVGVRRYPVLGIFPDLYSESLEQAKSVFSAYGYGEEDFTAWQVENIRRFRPKVLVGHDVNGEYGHGTHILNSETMREAVIAAADETKYHDSAQKYGVWDTPKTYLHLYPENSIVLDFDIPLDHFGGKTAYEMSQTGFSCHKSQHWTWFYDWMYGPEGARYTSASQITKYSPCLWGLWRSTVGADSGADMFENVDFYKKETSVAPEESDTAKLAESDTAPVPAVTEETAHTEPAEKTRTGLTVFIVIAAIVIVALIVCFFLYRSAQRKKRLRRIRAQRMRAARERAEREDQRRYR